MFIFKKKPPVSFRSLSPCLSGERIVQWGPLPHYLADIRELVSVEDKTWQEIYLPMVCRLAEFCQAMPFSADQFNGTYGLLERQLLLAAAVLKWRRGVLLPKNASIETIAAEEGQWTYALFSAALLRNIYVIQHDRMILLYRFNGEKGGTWMPMSGSLYQAGFYYEVRWREKTPAENLALFMAAIAGRVIPPMAVRWLAANPALHAVWWKSVLHEPSDRNVIDGLIENAAARTGIGLLTE